MTSESEFKTTRASNVYADHFFLACVLDRLPDDAAQCSKAPQPDRLFRRLEPVLRKFLQMDRSRRLRKTPDGCISDAGYSRMAPSFLSSENKNRRKQSAEQRQKFRASPLVLRGDVANPARRNTSGLW